MVRIFCRLWYYCGQTKNHRQNGGDFSRNGGPNRDRTDDLTDANRTLSQLSYRPILLLFAGFCNKKQIFMFFNFRRFRRKFSPKLWAETRRSMCDHRDANRTLSQLSYKPITYHIIIHIPRQNARGFPHLFSRAFRSANVPYYFFVFHLCRFCGILRCPAEVRRSLTRQATDTIHITK